MTRGAAAGGALPHERWGRARIRHQSWLLAGTTIAAWAVLRLVFGPMPQWLSYHDFADTRTWLGIPLAGDVLSNLAILAAGIWGATLARRVRVDDDERVAYRWLVVGAITTAFGSAYYHLDPNNATLFWDRLPMAVVMTAILALVLADRVDPRYGRESLLPFAFVGVGGVVYWAITESFGRGDLLLYMIVRAGISVVVLWMLVLRPGRTIGAKWLVAAVLLNVVMVISEHFDREIWELTRGVVSGHNLKHLIAGGVIACVFGWLLHRRARPDAVGRPPAQGRALKP